MLERSEGIDEVSCRGLGTRAILHHQSQSALLAREPGAPLAVAAVEDEHCVPGAQTQHVLQVIRLVPLEARLSPGGQIGGQKQAWGAEIVARHAFTFAAGGLALILPQPRDFCYA